MADRIPVFDPRISVVLKKNITREFITKGDGLGGSVPASGRFRGVEREIDLTPYLGEAGGVRTSKSVRQPAGGFSITLADRMYVGESRQQESLYGLIEPMDCIEIRFAHAPTAPAYASQYQRLDKQLPIIMRGFVSSVRRSETISPDGTPQRSVQISGQDYGKLWQIIQIRYLANFVVGQNLLSFLNFAQNYGVQAESYTPNEFIAETMSEVFNEFTAMMRQGDDNSPVRDVTLFDLSVPTGLISPFGVNQFAGGTLYEMIKHFGDVGPFNELFLEDREEGVACVYRPNPYRGVDGEFISGVTDFEPDSGTADNRGITEHRITDEEIVSQSMGRSDENIANYYWVDNPTYQLSSENLQRLNGADDDLATYFIEGYRNSDPALYGLRMMQLQTNQGPRFDGQGEGAYRAGVGEMDQWLRSRRELLVKANRDNVVFEAGNMTLRGNERLRAGNYLVTERGSLESRAYIDQVDHIYTPFRSFITNVQLVRGTGFISRAQKGRGRQSPYLSELSPRGVYGGSQ